ncbi:MAG: hypothetical protein JKX72_06225 [Robiginitomaculum sp.]|nr:hypothetical protein [Robiginitomaculum sp.]
MKTLTETRKADRLKMAIELERLALTLGAKVTRHEEGQYALGKRCIYVMIEAARGMNVTITFDGESWQHNTHVLSWHIKDSDARFSWVFQSVNNYHYAKATDIAEGFEALCAVIENRLTQAADGRAFCLDREAEQIAKHGTNAEQNAKWAKWREEMNQENQGAQNARTI